MTEDKSAGRVKLNTALQDPHQFRQFQADPKAFAALHGIKIDQKASDTIKAAAAKATSVADLSQIGISAMGENAIALIDATTSGPANTYVGGFNAGRARNER